MTTHGSATAHEETPALEQTPHETQPTNTAISNALKQRAQAVISDLSIDPRWRAIIRYGLEINDPWLPDLVGRAETGEPITDSVDFSLDPGKHN